MTQDPDAGWESGGTEAADTRGGGLKLPSLKQWRTSRGLTQGELADTVGVPKHYIQRVEQGKRGCNRSVAQRMADALEVDLQELRAGGSAAGDAGGSEKVRPGGSGEAAGQRLNSPRYLHQAYLELLLEREVGSAYLVLDERELKRYGENLSVEEFVEVDSKRRRELEFVEGLLEEAEPHPQVRLFLEELVRERPDDDIRVLATRRSRERSEEEREKLTRAMRELL
jgi:transcriptional regulator with XRE-family HTH domain